MNIVTIHHAVRDFATWKSGYDAHEAARRAAGCTAVTVSRSTTAADGSTDITIGMSFPDLTAAKGFLDDPNLAAAMQAAGVVGIPDIRVSELVETSSY